MNAIQARARYKAEIRNRILDAARTIVVHEGYESFSLRRLADKIEYSPAAIYKHFKNKTEIFDRLTEESFKALLAASSQVTFLEGEDSVECLERGMRAYVDFGLKNPDHYRLAFLLQSVERTRTIKSNAAYEALGRRVQRCIDEGRFRPGNVELMSQSLWAAAHGVTSLLVQKPFFPWVSRKNLISQVLKSAIEGLLVHGNGCQK